MLDFEKEQEKLEMLNIMKEKGWIEDTNENLSYEDVKKEFSNMTEEFIAIGRDWNSDEED